jgi:hypothetical protein
MTPDQILTGLAAGQYGVLTVDDALEAGLGLAAIEHRERSGRWRRVAPGVFVIAGHPDRWETRALAAVLSAPQAVLSHRAAAAVHELAGFRPAAIEVTAPRWLRPRRRDVVVHESLDLTSVDRIVRAGLPVTGVARTLIDLGAVVHPRRVSIALDDALRRGLVAMPALLERFRAVARRGRRGVGTMRRLLEERAELGAPPASPLETRLVDLLLDAGLPRPVSQHEVRDGGFVAYLDLAYPEVLLALEADGEAYHVGVERFRYDRRRQNRLELLGWQVLRYTDDDVRHHGGRVVDEVRTARHRRRGLVVPASASGR